MDSSIDNELLASAKITSKGQITIPKNIRLLLNVSDGDFLAEFKKVKKTKISSLVFDNYSDVLGYSTDTGKIFIYNISDLKKIFNNKNIYNEKKNDNNKKVENKTNEINQIKIKIKIKDKPIASYNIEEGKNIRFC